MQSSPFHRPIYFGCPDLRGLPLFLHPKGLDSRSIGSDLIVSPCAYHVISFSSVYVTVSFSTPKRRFISSLVIPFSYRELGTPSPVVRHTMKRQLQSCNIYFLSKLTKLQPQSQEASLNAQCILYANTVRRRNIRVLTLQKPPTL